MFLMNVSSSNFSGLAVFNWPIRKLDRHVIHPMRAALLASFYFERILAKEDDHLEIGNDWRFALFVYELYKKR
jgi:hypothetical protein